MSNISKVLKAPADGRYDRGWCEPKPQKAKRCVDKNIRVLQKPLKSPARKDRFVRHLNRPISKKIQKLMRNPAWRARQVAQLRAAAKKQAWFEEVGSNLISAERWAALPENFLAAPGMLVGAVVSLLGAGCVFNKMGLREDCDANPCDATRVDTGVPDTGTVDAAIDTGVDAEVLPGEPPVITWPKIGQLTNGTHVNNRIFWRLEPPQTAPDGRTVVGMEIDHTRNGAYVGTTAVDLATPYGTVDATQPYAMHEFDARAIYDDGSTSDDASLAVPTNGALVVRLGMNEGQGTALQDASGHMLNASLVGFNSGSEWTQGLYGSGALFNGTSSFGDFSDSAASSDATAFDSMNFNGTVPFAVEAVINRTNTGACSTIVGRFDVNNGWHISLDSANHLFFAAYGDSGDSLRAQSVQTFDVPGNERHLTVSFGGSPDGSDITMSVDGASVPVEVLSFPLVSTTASNQVSTLIGAFIPAGGTAADADCVLEGGFHYLAVYRGHFASPHDSRHVRCAFLAEESTIPLPGMCD